MKTQLPYQRSIKITSVTGEITTIEFEQFSPMCAGYFGVEPSDLVSTGQTDGITLSTAMLFQIFPDAFLNTAGVYFYFIFKTLSK